MYKVNPSNFARSIIVPIPFVIPAGAGKKFRAILPADSTYYAVIHGLVADAPAVFNVVDAKDGAGRSYMSGNNPISSAIMFGSYAAPKLPYEYPIPLVLAENTAMYWDLEDPTGAGFAGELGVIMYKHTDLAHPPEIGYRRIDVDMLDAQGKPTGRKQSVVAPGQRQQDRAYPFMATGVVTVPAGDKKTMTILNPAGCDLIVKARYGFSTQTANGGFAVRQFMTNGDEWDFAAVRRDNGWGTQAGYPGTLFAPRTVKATKLVTSEVTDLSGFQNDVTLILDGVRRYAA